MKFNQRQGNQKRRGNILPVLSTTPWQITHMSTNQSYFLIAAFFSPEAKMSSHFHLATGKNDEIIEKALEGLADHP